MQAPGRRLFPASASVATDYSALSVDARNADTADFLLGFCVQKLYLVKAESTAGERSAIFASLGALLAAGPLKNATVSHV